MRDVVQVLHHRGGLAAGARNAHDLEAVLEGQGVPVHGPGGVLSLAVPVQGIRARNGGERAAGVGDDGDGSLAGDFRAVRRPGGIVVDPARDQEIDLLADGIDGVEAQPVPVDDEALVARPVGLAAHGDERVRLAALHGDLRDAALGKLVAHPRAVRAAGGMRAPLEGELRWFSASKIGCAEGETGDGKRGKHTNASSGFHRDTSTTLWLGLKQSQTRDCNANQPSRLMAAQQGVRGAVTTESNSNKAL
jgi:hypothetical protein